MKQNSLLYIIPILIVLMFPLVLSLHILKTNTIAAITLFSMTFFLFVACLQQLFPHVFNKKKNRRHITNVLLWKKKGKKKGTQIYRNRKKWKEKWKEKGKKKKTQINRMYWIHKLIDKIDTFYVILFFLMGVIGLMVNYFL